jgi:hypothetical protein
VTVTGVSTAVRPVRTSIAVADPLLRILGGLILNDLAAGGMTVSFAEILAPSVADIVTLVWAVTG